MSNIPLTAVLCLALRDMPNEILASATLGLYGFRKIAPANKAYKPFLDAKLIREDGTAVEHEELLNALAFEIKSRRYFEPDFTRSCPAISD